MILTNKYWYDFSDATAFHIFFHWANYFLYIFFFCIINDIKTIISFFVYRKIYSLIYFFLDKNLLMYAEFLFHTFPTHLSARAMSFLIIFLVIKLKLFDRKAYFSKHLLLILIVLCFEKNRAFWVLCICIIPGSVLDNNANLLVSHKQMWHITPG